MCRSRRAWIATLACAMLISGVAHAGELATDEKRGISLRVPDGFHDFPAGMAQPLAIFSYARGEPGEPGFELFAVTGLGGTIGRDDFDPTPIVAGLASTIGLTIVGSSRLTMHWKEFELDGFVATLRRDDQVATLAGVQIPVRGEAVQILVMRLGEDAVGGELQAVLDTLAADSNWLTTSDRTRRIVIGGVALLASITLVLALVIHRRRRAPAKRAT